ncbi:26S proteasome non-ATPase regulatory subunit 1 [Rhynchocyon petersi]
MSLQDCPPLPSASSGSSRRVPAGLSSSPLRVLGVLPPCACRTVHLPCTSSGSSRRVPAGLSTSHARPRGPPAVCLQDCPPPMHVLGVLPPCACRTVLLSPARPRGPPSVCRRTVLPPCACRTVLLPCTPSGSSRRVPAGVSTSHARPRGPPAVCLQDCPPLPSASLGSSLRVPQDCPPAVCLQDCPPLPCASSGSSRRVPAGLSTSHARPRGPPAVCLQDCPPLPCASSGSSRRVPAGLSTSHARPRGPPAMSLQDCPPLPCASSGSPRRPLCRRTGGHPQAAAPLPTPRALLHPYPSRNMGLCTVLPLLGRSEGIRLKHPGTSVPGSQHRRGIVPGHLVTAPRGWEFALHKLNAVVNDFWAEISESVDKIEVLYEDEGFRSRQFAALVASKVFYHLGAFEESLNYALGAGDLFNVNDNSEYVETIIAKCIDHYTKQCVENADLPEGEKKPIDQRLEGIVNKMFQRCLDDHKYKQAVGIALETRRLDIFEKTILESNDVPGMLAYSLKLCMSLMQNKQFRNKVLRVLVKIYMNLEKPDFINVCQCLIFLDDPQAVSDILEKLVKEDNLLMAYQICFDLYESASQQFLSSVIQNLRTVGTPIASVPGSTNTGTVPGSEKDSESMETEDKTGSAVVGKTPEASPEPKDQTLKMIKILSGEMAIELHLQFLIRNNNTDLMILKNTKDAVRNSVCHTATVIANSFMHCGTTSDQFLRDNLEWLARATNWAKFTATASLGVIHKGHEKEALQLMATYLPKDTSPGSAYQEGGGLYALGLIHANHGGDIIDYLLNQLKNASNDIVRHGGSLGLGLAAMGTARQDVYDLLKTNLYQDDAVTGEAAGLALGLVMLGSKNAQAIEDMVGYAQETQHEKILRGLAVGIALVMYGRMEEADALIESLCRDKDPILRRSGMYTVAMAYCGSGNNKAIRRLLHVAVSDVNDDVRRAAVESLGFILFRTPEQCPSVVSLLSESYNPHVRYGAAMALGICCAGTGNKEAINLLEPMTNDPVNYVRQGALIASALIMIQQTEITCPKVNQFRQLYSKVINDKHDDVMAKFGAILAQGILDAGGHNVTISLQSRTGHTHMPSVVGVLVFTQFWFWFPLSHFLSLAYTPTCVIGLNKDLKMPKVQYKSNCKPSTFAYPAPLEVPKEKEKEKVSTAVLSITAKAKKKEKEKEKKEEEKMEVDEAEKKEEKEKKKEPEPNFQLLDNPARAMPAQLKVLTMTETCRYQPFKPLSIGGIIILKDTSEDIEELVEPVAAHGPKIEEEEQEPEPPEPFEYIDD